MEINLEHYKKIFLTVFFISVCCAFYFTATMLPENLSIYLLFSILFLALLCIGFIQERLYCLTFLSLFLWLGFWVKTTSALLTGRLVETVGAFRSSPESWRKVLEVSIAGGLGCLVAYALLIWIVRKKKGDRTCDNKNLVPQWYSSNRLLSYLIAIGGTAFLSIFNYSYGIHIVGLSPAPNWPFVILKVYIWIIMNGLAAISCTFLFWDFQLNKKLYFGFYLVLIEAFMTNTFKLSRGYVFHVLPQLYAYFLAYGKIISLKSFFAKSIFVITLLGLFVGSLKVTNQLRKYYFSEAMAAENSTIYLDHDDSNYSSNFMERTIGFVINRWIGLEGVMAVTAFEGTSYELFKQGVFDLAQPGKASVLDEVIAKTTYTKSNRGRVQFGSLPGGIAFFNFSGSLTITFLGMFFLTLCAAFIELCCLKLTQNPFLCAYVGASVALAVSQFGYQPLKFFSYHFVFLLTFVAIYCIQNFSSIEIKNKFR